MKRYWSVALVLLLLVAFFSSKHCVEGRSLLRMTHSSSQAVRGLQTSKEMKEEKPLRGENDSFRRIPRTGSNPSQNKYNLPVGVQGSRKQQITAATKP
ncbi:hypothetical protein Bca4012_096547 [Brassica carinata]|uniref:Uncharacterized protein n=4 Tax=Brassica TaxID=3705 RepID=A0A0D3DWU8_BRAOL|nr:PREDICTED: uncharacterized protein LOC106312751 [Brassica oleracea var. oleracea]KAF3572335.1 hypothetical protein F2Q69_00063194 [Brassica cretica]KAG2259604.1 hypothetical protein Bca52824_078898 [Brassica carinata]CAF2114903.1 unnamed protein product [Brassica napus]